VDAQLPTTRATLLARLRQDPTDQVAWDAFVERYGRHVYRWCRQWKLQDADAEDVTQLKTVAHHAWRDFMDTRPCRAAGGDAHVREMMQTLEAREDLVQTLAEAFDLELLEAAKLRVRLRVAPHTWEAFRLLALEGMPVTEVAATVHMQVAMVYVAKSKVQKMLREEIRKLEAGS
jgi:DNA-directed RNA polymerase specialized sigma24 family protein